MKAWVDIAAVLGASVALHAAGLAFLGDGGSPRGGSGDGGVAATSALAVNSAYAALAETWDRPPDIPEQPVMSPLAQMLGAPSGPAADAPGPLPPPRPGSLAEPAVDEAPTAPLPIAPGVAAAPAMLELPMRVQPEDFPTPVREIRPTTLVQPALQAPDTGVPPSELDQSASPERTVGVDASPRPVTRPQNQTPAEPSALRPSQVAAGAGSGSTQGTSDRDATANAVQADPALMAVWGAQIQARVAASVPRVQSTGQVTLRIVVGRNGRLQSVAVVQSSGNLDLDRAAIRLVQRTGRFPRAPAGLSGESFPFDVPLHFTP